MNAKKMRKTIVAGNWKMNASKDSVESLVTDILSGMQVMLVLRYHSLRTISIPLAS